MKKRIISIFIAVAIILPALPSITASAEEPFSMQGPTISAGDGNSFAITQDGQLWGWGFNGAYRVLGDGSSQEKFVPVKILDSVVSVATGTNQRRTMAMRTDGSLWEWGIDSFSESFRVNTTPVKKWDSVASAAPSSPTYIIQNDGSLWSSGRRDFIGLGEGIDSVPLTRLMDSVVSVSSSGHHTMVIKTDGSLWGWGDNYYGSIGDGGSGISARRYTPVKIMDSVVSVSAGSGHTAAITTDGSLWVWGRNNNGQVGNGKSGHRDDFNRTPEHSSTPEKIMDSVVSVSAGGEHTMAIKTDGSLWGWGGNDDGQVGNGTTTNQLTPIKIMDSVAAVSASFGHTLALKTDGTLWAWGRNFYGQLGDGTNINKDTPIQIMEGVMLPGGAAPVNSQPITQTKTEPPITAMQVGNQPWAAWDTREFCNTSQQNLNSNSALSNAIIDFYRNETESFTNPLIPWTRVELNENDKRMSETFKTLFMRFYQNDDFVKMLPFNSAYLESILNNVDFYFASRAVYNAEEFGNSPAGFYSHGGSNGRGFILVGQSS